MRFHLTTKYVEVFASTNSRPYYEVLEVDGKVVDGFVTVKRGLRIAFYGKKCGAPKIWVWTWRGFKRRSPSEGIPGLEGERPFTSEDGAIAEENAFRFEQQELGELHGRP